MVSCCLWFAGGPIVNAVHLAWIDLESWSALRTWTATASAPALARLLDAPLPANISSDAVSLLVAECEIVDWSTLHEPALGGFASLSLVIDRAAAQSGAGLRFSIE
jgi:hypothetical protein